jgi:sulfocyanin SoxE-like protein
MKRLLALSVLAAGPLFSQSPPKVDATWLKVDSVAKKADFSLVAALTPANGGMNFNGAGAGALTLTVPLKWTVVLHFSNKDQVLPHSAMVIAATTPVPVSGAKPAFEHAVTHQAEQGLPSDGHEDVQFVADRPGSYLIYCAVPGHGAAGMWIRLEVSGIAHQPELVATPPKGP